MKENRKAPRYKIDQLIDVSYGREEFINATGINISELGLFCQIDKPVDMHDRIYLLISDRKHSKPIELEGVVIRIEKKGKQLFVGIEFADITSSAKTALKRLIKNFK